MQTKMIAKYFSISYICPKCDFRYSLRGGIFDNCELSEKVLQKVKNSTKKCPMCKEAFLEPKSIECEVEPIVNKPSYEIGWLCEKCNTRWHSIHDITPGSIGFMAKIDKIEKNTICINEDCKNNDVKTISRMYNR